MFGPVEATRTWKEDGTQLFSVETESDRLGVGPIDTVDGGATFGIARLRGASSEGENGKEQEKDLDLDQEGDATPREVNACSETQFPVSM